jgi:phage baseplate assembly protein gpV
MALKLSTGLRNYLLGEGCMRKAFEDALLKIYSGTAPTEADDEVGTLLCTIRNASATIPTTRSTPLRQKITIAHAGDAPDVGDTVKLLIDGAAFEYAATSAENTVTKLATKVAQLLNDYPQISAMGTYEAGGVLYLQGRFDGAAVPVITENTSTGALTVTVATATAAVATDTLKLGAPALGVISKKSDQVWSGPATATGTAGYFRLVNLADGGDDDTDYSDLRIQGTVSTSGADLNLSNINIVSGATQSIDTFALTLPAA